MPTEFEPRQVTASDALAWFKEAFGLILRRPHYFVLPVLPVLLLAFEPLIYLVLYPIFYLLLFTIQLSLSEVADNSNGVRVTRLWHQLKQVLMLNAGLYGGMMFMRIIVLVMLQMGYTPPLVEQVNIDKMPEWMQHINELSSLGIVLLIFLQFIQGLFRHALLIFHDLPADVARHLSRKATLLNYMVIWRVSAAILFVHFLSFFAPSWAGFVIQDAILLLLPAYLYVAYRHIFLGKKENAPVKVRQIIGAPVHGHN